MNQSAPAPPLLDLLDLPSGDPSAGDSSANGALADRARRLVAFSLADYERIRGLDEDLGLLALRYKDPQGANAIRRLYRQWAEQADALLHRLRTDGLRERLSADYEKLDYSVGRTLAMLSITLESLKKADEQIARGEVHSLEEVRRELRARSHARGAAYVGLAPGGATGGDTRQA